MSFRISNGVSRFNVPPVLAKSTRTENWQLSFFFSTNITAEQKTYWGDWVCVKNVANNSFVILWAQSGSAKIVFHFHGLLHPSIATFVEYRRTQNKNYSSLRTITIKIYVSTYLSGVFCTWLVRFRCRGVLVRFYVLILLITKISW